MNSYFMQKVQYILTYPQKVFNLPSVIINMFILTILLSLAHTSYLKIGQACKERLKAKKLHWNRIATSLWQIVCCVILILICSHRLYTLLPSPNEGNSTKETNESSEVVFSLICAFHIHEACMSCRLNGFGRVSIRWLLATTALCISYAAKCFKVSIISVLTWSATSLIMDLICVSINIAEMVNRKPMGANASLSIAVLFTVVWAFFYLYIYPLFVLLPVSAMNSPKSSINFMSLLLLSLWGVYILDWMSTPFFKFLWMCLTRSFPSNWMIRIFSIKRNEVAEKLLLIRKGEREKEQAMANHFAQSEEMKIRQNSQSVVQTIKCSKITTFSSST
ncbi:uncharacterized protein LOC124171904 isoform X2 [Ischnura elegans]|uniref:uncharacterized protein LOC124171904 isoform X2 n=1 Tax=Ischnura elegans TaxID=197161 RepID=UPI001ED8887D|nr:uncharacterized protein LOC124171904 isoform X2 [Ischnura elegans]